MLNLRRHSSNVAVLTANNYENNTCFLEENI